MLGGFMKRILLLIALLFSPVLWAADTAIVDVRSDKEYREGHI
jgi:rhodanese-related sulfurtransferase